MQVEIVTPDETVWEGEAESVLLPGADGQFEILNNHAPLIAALSNGNMRIRTGGKDEHKILSGGIVKVLHNHVIILAEKVLSKL